MEQLEGERAGCILWLDGNNHLYVKNRHRKQKFYFRCREDFCPARAVVDNFAPPVLSVCHNHDPDELMVEVLRMKSELRRRCSTENTSINVIFNEIELKYSREAVAQIGGLNSMRSLMYRSRNVGCHQVPQNLREYATSLKETKWRERYATERGPAKAELFRRFIITEDQSTVVIFVSPTILRYINQTAEVHLHIEATFKVEPKSGTGCYLFVINLYHEKTDYPVVFGLIDRKSVAAYTEVLTVLRQLAPQINAVTIMTDYEEALQEAVLAVFPKACVLGCWFHFARAVYKRATSMGLLKRDAHDETRCIIQMAVALPLLPKDLVDQGLQELKTDAENQTELTQFISYIENRWLPNDTFGLSQNLIANNAILSSFKDLLRLVSREHQNMWVFTESLQRMEHAKSVDFLQNLNPQGRERIPSSKIPKWNTQLLSAQNAVESDGNVRQSLLQMSHTLRVRGLLNIISAGLVVNDDVNDDANDDLRTETIAAPVVEQTTEQPQPIKSEPVQILHLSSLETSLQPDSQDSLSCPSTSVKTEKPPSVFQLVKSEPEKVSSPTRIQIRFQPYPQDISSRSSANNKLQILPSGSPPPLTFFKNP